MRIAITGGTGFVGSALIPALRARGHHVEFVTRNQIGLPGALAGCTVVIHLAALAHVSENDASKEAGLIDQVNGKLPSIQLRASVAAGVSRFVFLSSIKAVCEQTRPGMPVRADSIPAPSTMYGRSKSDAEASLRQHLGQTELQIVRSPLVYGPGVKANFSLLLKVLNSGVPLPLQGIDNLRSYIGVRNLVGFLIHCIEYPKRTPVILHASDGHDLSTPDLVAMLGEALGKPPRLYSIPRKIARLGGKLFGFQAMVDRLWGTLQLEVNETFRTLSWTPPYDVESELDRTARFFLRKDNKNL